jgi:ribonucleoside-diphosphate reductase alpha chain
MDFDGLGVPGEGPVFKIDEFCHTVDVMATAMDIVCGFSQLPTEHIQQNTRDMRQLGMGFTNLGAAIMAQGYPYDSEEGRAFAASITALLTGRAYAHSARMAEEIGSFKLFEANREPMLDVIDKHMSYLPEPATEHQSALASGKRRATTGHRLPPRARSTGSATRWPLR